MELREFSFAINEKTIVLTKNTMVFLVSGWQDSNLRPPAPKAGAMTGLRYTPRCFLKKVAERQGFEPWRRLPVDRLAICSITTLAPLLRTLASLSKRGCKYISKFSINQSFLKNFYNFFSIFF